MALEPILYPACGSSDAVKLCFHTLDKSSVGFLCWFCYDDGIWNGYRMDIPLLNGRLKLSLSFSVPRFPLA